MTKKRRQATTGAMTPAEFTAVGVLLYGPLWRRPLAADLGKARDGKKAPPVDRGLVHRWSTGARPVPVWVREALPGIIKDRIAECRSALEMWG